MHVGYRQRCSKELRGTWGSQWNYLRETGSHIPSKPNSCPPPVIQWDKTYKKITTSFMIHCCITCVYLGEIQPSPWPEKKSCRGLIGLLCESFRGQTRNDPPYEILNTPLAFRLDSPENVKYANIKRKSNFKDVCLDMQILFHINSPVVSAVWHILNVGIFTDIAATMQSRTVVDLWSRDRRIDRKRRRAC